MIVDDVNAMQMDEDSPKVRIPPPLVFLFSIFLGWGIQKVHPLPILSDSLRFSLFVLFLGSGMSLMAYCAIAFKRAKTNLLPWKTTNTIVTSGAYRFTRNPIYVAFVLIGLGIACVANNPWMAATLVLFVWIVQQTAILKEERYLEQKFGREYLDYKSRVRRWV